jgi:hypothetical protein
MQFHKPVHQLLRPAFIFLLGVLTFTGVAAQINKGKVTQSWGTDTSNVSIPLDELWIFLKRDGIPPIDDPLFYDETEAAGVFFENEPVVTVVQDSIAKAYPLSILTYHEVLNDRSGNVYYCVSYCPLCNSAVVFNRRLEHLDKEYLLDFGTSGMLRKSNLVMWDRQTETWWQQITGTGLAGELAGVELDMLPCQIISVSDFFESYPGGLILSTKTGHNRKYGVNPYEHYDDAATTQPRLFDEEPDQRLPAMERVVHIFGKQTPKIYPFSLMQEEHVINDSHEDLDVVVFFKDGAVSILDDKQISESKTIGSVTVYSPIVDGQKLTFTWLKNGFKDKQTASLWNLTGQCIEGQYRGRQLKPVVYGNHFAFAWLYLYPETVIYGQ